MEWSKRGPTTYYHFVLIVGIIQPNLGFLLPDVASPASQDSLRLRRDYRVIMIANPSSQRAQDPDTPQMVYPLGGISVLLEFVLVHAQLTAAQKEIRTESRHERSQRSVTVDPYWSRPARHRSRSLI